MPNEKIVILDFGSQYAHLIAKRFRLMGFYSEISQPSAPIESFAGAKGIVFSGGLRPCTRKTFPHSIQDILKLEIPILGLCYGHQLMAQEYGGKSREGRSRRIRHRSSCEKNPLPVPPIPHLPSSRAFRFPPRCG